MVKTMENKTDEIVAGFGVRKTYKGQGNWDKYYIDYIVKDVVVKTGDGEEDFSIEKKIIESKRDIRQTIQADAQNAGIVAYLKQTALTGEIPNIHVSDEIQDFSKMPDNLADALKVADKTKEAFNSIDPALRGNSSIVEFLQSITPEKLKKYIGEKFTSKEHKTDDVPGKDEK